MRGRVELAGRPWQCGPGGPRTLPWEDATPGTGTVTVGGRAVAWARDAAFVRVSHAGGVPILAALMGVTAAEESYDVRLVTSRTGGSGTRVWWACPACGRRCERLYLPAGRPRLACRLCCRLVYASQYAGRWARKRRNRRR
jgi:hypothetical protein